MQRSPRTVAALVLSAFALPAPAQSASEHFTRGQAFEREGKGAEAVRAYTAAARGADCRATVRLGEIYDKDRPAIANVAKDYAESLKWYHAARALDCEPPAAASETAKRAMSGRERSPVYKNYGTPAQAFERAVALEKEGHGREAIAHYRAAARGGDCQAAKRLGEIYEHSLAGVQRDYGQALNWYNVARVLGCDAPVRSRS